MSKRPPKDHPPSFLQGLIEPTPFSSSSELLQASNDPDSSEDAPIEDEDEDDDEDDEFPRVVVATVADLSGWVPELTAKQHGSRPVWFMLEQDADLAGVFDRLPESKMPKTSSDAILAGLRTFSLEKSDGLQELLGITESIQYGFHIDASLDDVIESFEDDGFEVVATIQGGSLVEREY